MKTKTIIIAAGVGAAALAYWAYRKVNSLKAVFDNMQIWPSKVSNIKFAYPILSFNLDIAVKNPTDTSFSLTGVGVAKLSRIVVSRNGAFLGQADVDMQAIEIPAFSTSTIQNLPFKVSLLNVLSNVLADTNIDINQLSISAVIEVLGQSYTIQG